MSKFGIGVGDEFPVDDGHGQGAGGDQGQPRDDRAEFEEWKRRKDAHRAQREQWRAQREEWRNRKRAFKERVRAAARESFGDDWDDRRYGRGYGRRGGFRFPLVALIPILGLVLVIALIAAIIKSPFVFLGLALLGFFFFAHRHHHHDHRFAGHGWHRHDGRDYDFDMKPSRGPAAGNSAVVTPPPSPEAGQTPPATPQ